MALKMRGGGVLLGAGAAFSVQRWMTTRNGNKEQLLSPVLLCTRPCIDTNSSGLPPTHRPPTP